MPPTAGGLQRGRGSKQYRASVLKVALEECLDRVQRPLSLCRHRERKNLIARAVGVGSYIEVEIHDHHTEPGDIYLLCSGGLYDVLAVEEIIYILMNYLPSPEAACSMLVRQANVKGGHDNISVILIMVHRHIVETDGLFRRMVRWMKQGVMES